ncbi:MAG: 1,4-alpha-glucan-branching enzyme, partial [Anaerolineae bacterium]|nr:1,4-alpha-glucan-branching enzyme [Anaerolineae bacterium]
AFWLMDKEMYWHMKKNDTDLVIERGMALHKMIRLITMALGGEAYLNFIGNEFGHPEWIDFPREGNNWSYKYARRQWSLVDDKDLKYKYLNEFDTEMIALAKSAKLLQANKVDQLNMDTTNNVVIFERAGLVFLFNFHPQNAIPDYRFKVGESGKYKILLNSDMPKFGGFNRVDDVMSYPVVTLFGEHFLSIYLPNRTCLVLKKV